MPQIPLFYAKEQLPSTGGQQARGGIVGAPGLQQPGMQDAGPSALEQSLGALPQALQQSGELMLRTEELQQHRLRAQNTLDAATRRQDTRPQLSGLLDQLKQGPYQTLPEDFLKQGNDLITAQGESLNPQAKALFTEKAKEDLAMLYNAALQERSQRRDAATTMSVMTEVNWLQSQYHKAGSEAERLMLKDDLHSLLTSFVGSGLMKGEVGAKIMADTENGIATEQARMRIRTDPSSALQAISARMKPGGTTDDEAISNVSPALLPDLWDEATKQLEHRVTVQEHDAARQRRTLQEQQSMVAGNYRASIYKPGVSAQELIQLVDPINKDFRLQRLGEQDQQQLLGHIQTMLHKMEDDKYKDRNIPEVAHSAWLRIYSAQTPADLDVAQRFVQGNTSGLSVETMQSMLNKIDIARDKNNPLNDDYAREAKRVFLEGAFPGGVIPAVMDKIDGATQGKISQGLNLLYDELRRIYDTEGKSAMQQKAVETGRRLLDLYFPQGAGGMSKLPSGMPPVFQGIENFEDGLMVLDTLKDSMSPEQRRKYYLQLKESLPRKSPLSGTPSVPGLEKVPGVKKSSTPYAPMEQR